jgi:hypothetical protein
LQVHSTSLELLENLPLSLHTLKVLRCRGWECKDDSIADLVQGLTQ